MANSNDDQNAASKPPKPRPEWGKTGFQVITKPREQAKLGEYPKRRSDDEY
jgi:hypothetical protein